MASATPAGNGRAREPGGGARGAVSQRRSPLSPLLVLEEGGVWSARGGRGREVGRRSWVAGTPAGGPGRTPPPRRWPPGAAPGGPRRQQALALLTPNGSQSPPAPILTVCSWTTAATPCSFVGAREVRGHEMGALAALRRSQLNVTLREGDTRGAKGHGRRGRAVSSGLCKEVPVQPRFEIRRICSKRPGAKAGRACQAEGAAGAGPRGGEERGRREPPRQQSL